MADLKQQIRATEDWLREHPNADWVARHDMIARLADLKEQEQLTNQTSNLKNLDR